MALHAKGDAAPAHVPSCCNLGTAPHSPGSETYSDMLMWWAALWGARCRCAVAGWWASCWAVRLVVGSWPAHPSACHPPAWYSSPMPAPLAIPNPWLCFPPPHRQVMHAQLSEREQGAAAAAPAPRCAAAVGSAYCPSLALLRASAACFQPAATQRVNSSSRIACALHAEPGRLPAWPVTRRSLFPCTWLRQHGPSGRHLGAVRGSRLPEEPRAPAISPPCICEDPLRSQELLDSCPIHIGSPAPLPHIPQTAPQHQRLCRPLPCRFVCL